MQSAVELRDAAIDRVEENANEQWHTEAMEGVRWLAQQSTLFTTDDVWEHLATVVPEAKTHDNRAMGAVMRKAQKLGWISATDRYWQSKRPMAHARPIRVWKSALE
jgi:hypothetical protein